MKMITLLYLFNEKVDRYLKIIKNVFLFKFICFEHEILIPLHEALRII